MNVFELSRNYFEWCFNNPEKVRPTHTAIYFFAIEHCNRLGWKEKFGFPSQMAMEAIGVKNWRTYSTALNDLVEWGFIKYIEKSKNQYSSNIIAIVKNTKATTKALDKALQKHSQKQGTKQGQSTVSIDIQETINKKQETKERLFDIFWDKYDYKKSKDVAFKKWMKLKDADIEKIMEVVDDYVKSTPNKNFRKHPSTWLNQKCWNDEIILTEKKQEENIHPYLKLMGGRYE